MQFVVFGGQVLSFGELQEYHGGGFLGLRSHSQLKSTPHEDVGYAGVFAEHGDVAYYIDGGDVGCQYNDARGSLLDSFHDILNSSLEDLLTVEVPHKFQDFGSERVVGQRVGDGRVVEILSHFTFHVDLVLQYQQKEQFNLQQNLVTAWNLIPFLIPSLILHFESAYLSDSPPLFNALLFLSDYLLPFPYFLYSFFLSIYRPLLVSLYLALYYLNNQTYMFKTRKQHICSKILPDSSAPLSSKFSLKTSTLQHSLSHPLLSSLHSNLSSNQTELSLHHHGKNVSKLSSLTSSQQLFLPPPRLTHQFTRIDSYLADNPDSHDQTSRDNSELVAAKSNPKRGVLGSRDSNKVSLRNLLLSKKLQMKMAREQKMVAKQLRNAG